MSQFVEIKKSIIEKGYISESSLPVLSRMGEDPGTDYFETLKNELRELFRLLEGSQHIDRELACGLFGLAHISQTNYQAAIDHGKTFRDDLMDPDMLEIEMLVDSIFSGEWNELFEE